MQSYKDDPFRKKWTSKIHYLSFVTFHSNTEINFGITPEDIFIQMKQTLYHLVSYISTR